MTTITAKQLDILHHTLGLRPDRREPFRNHFMAGPGHHDQPDLEVLEASGLMVRAAPPGFCNARDVLFRVTEAGRALALDQLPWPPKRTRYQQFLDDDFGHSFAEWLGIEAPKYEFGGFYGNHKEQFRLSSSRARGEWKPTKKAAKVSYKEALRARRMVHA